MRPPADVENLTAEQAATAQSRRVGDLNHLLTLRDRLHRTRDVIERATAAYYASRELLDQIKANK